MVLLTGGAGFIGSCVLKKLNEMGITNIVIVDHLINSKKYKNLVGKKFDCYLDKNMLFDYLESDKAKTIDVIVHLGACTDTKEQNVDLILNDNYYYSQYLFDWTAKNGKRLIYASSSATYGNGKKGFDDDINQLEKLEPLGPYAFSKHLFDMWAWQQEKKPKQLIGLKFFNVYGPNEYHKGSMASVVYQMVNQVLSKKLIDIFYNEKLCIKKGEQARDLIYVKDLAKIILFFIKNPSIKSSIYNVGTGEAVDFNTLGRVINEVTKADAEIVYSEMPKELLENYQVYTRANIAKLREAGYDEKFTSIEKGVREYVMNFLSKKQYF